MDDQVLEVARMLQGEAGVLGLQGMLAVATTVINRLHNDEFYPADAVWTHQQLEHILKDYYGDDDPLDLALALASMIVISPRGMWVKWMCSGIGLDIPDDMYYCMSKQDVENNGWPEGDVVISKGDDPYELHLFSTMPEAEQ